GLDARVGRLDVPAEFIRRVPAGVVPGRAQRGSKRIVIVHKRSGAHTAILLGTGQRTEVERAGGTDHAFQCATEAEIERAHEIEAAAVDRVHPGVDFCGATDIFSYDIHLTAAGGEKRVVSEVP